MFPTCSTIFAGNAASKPGSHVFVDFSKTKPNQEMLLTYVSALRRKCPVNKWLPHVCKLSEGNDPKHCPQLFEHFPAKMPHQQTVPTFELCLKEINQLFQHVCQLFARDAPSKLASHVFESPINKRCPLLNYV